MNKLEFSLPKFGWNRRSSSWGEHFYVSWMRFRCFTVISPSVVEIGPASLGKKIFKKDTRTMSPFAHGQRFYCFKLNWKDCGRKAILNYLLFRQDVICLYSKCVIWLKYFQFSVKLYPINQSIHVSRFLAFQPSSSSLLSSTSLSLNSATYKTVVPRIFLFFIHKIMLTQKYVALRLEKYLTVHWTSETKSCLNLRRLQLFHLWNIDVKNLDWKLIYEYSLSSKGHNSHKNEGIKISCQYA